MAAYVSPATVVTGTTIASAWGNSVKTALDRIANPPSCRVYHNAAQSIPDNTVTTVAFNSERWDTASMHDTAVNNSRITIPEAGLYLVEFHARLATATDYLALFCDLRVNGATSIAEARWHPTITPTDTRNYQVFTVWKFAAADYVEARVFQDNTPNAARNLESTSAVTPEFAATYIGLG